MKKIKIIAFLLTFILTACCLAACADNTQNIDGNDDDPTVIDDGGIDLEKPLEYLILDGQSEYRILIAETATLTEENAAAELQQYLLQVTDVRLGIVRDTNLTSASSTQKFISVGKTKLFDKSGIELKNMNLDGFVIKSIGNVFYICGYRDRGTLYAAYDFLEKYAGIKYLSPNYEYIPSIDDIRLYETDIREVPAFMMRSPHVSSSTDLVYAPKARVTSPHQSKNGTEKIGGAFRDDWISDFHSFSRLVPYATYGTAHPEWYTANSSVSQLVLSNGLNNDGTWNGETETVLGKVIEKTKQDILENPKVSYYMIGQNDNQVLSANTRCLWQKDNWGGWGGQLAVFTNAVSYEIEKWMAGEGIEREIYFSFFAYQYSQYAPLDGAGEPVKVNGTPLKLRDNVIVMYAPVDASFNEAFNREGSVVNEPYRRIFENWAKVTKYFFIFDYNTNFRDYLSWYPNIEAVSENLKLYLNMGTLGVITNGPTNSRGYYQLDLNNYILAKLLWNPKLDVNELIDEFNFYMYGAKAGEITTDLVHYMNMHFKNIYHTPAMGDTPERYLPAYIYSNRSLWLVSESTLSKSFLDAATLYIEDAYKAIEEDETASAALKVQRRKNLLLYEIQVQYMKYKNMSIHFSNEKEKTLFLQDFFYNALELKIPRFAGGNTNTVVQDMEANGIR